MKKPTIALLTDFGSSDYYAGLMKAVILSIAPDANIIDLSHSIQPQNVRQAAFLLSTSYKYFPDGTIFVCVIDPEVGTHRKAIAVKAGSWYFIAPDNGVLTYVIDELKIEKAIILNNCKYHLPAVSATFHGRDIFAPVSAHLANGVPFEDLGTALDVVQIQRLEKMKCIWDDKGNWHGEIIYIDGFGNLITTITAEALGILSGEQPLSDWSIHFAGRKIESLHQTFADVKSGEFIAYIGSGGHLEIAVRDGNAAEITNAYMGMEVVVKRIN